MKLKHFSLFCLIVGALLLSVGLLCPLLHMENENATVGIIGGPDLPTYQLLLFRYADGLFLTCTAWGIALLLTGLFCLLFGKTVAASCTVKTTAIALGLSATGAAGLHCALEIIAMSAFGEQASYPIRFPFFLSGGFLCLCCFGGLLAWYFDAKKSQSAKGILIDVITAIVYTPALFLTFFRIVSILLP